MESQFCCWRGSCRLRNYLASRLSVHSADRTARNPTYVSRLLKLESIATADEG